MNNNYLPMLKEFIGDKAILDEGGSGFIFGVKGDKLQHIADVRGWGAIQHLFKTEKEAANFQDEIGKFIASAITEKLIKQFQSTSIQQGCINYLEKEYEELKKQDSYHCLEGYEDAISDLKLFVKEYVSSTPTYELKELK